MNKEIDGIFERLPNLHVLPLEDRHMFSKNKQWRKNRRQIKDKMRWNKVQRLSLRCMVV